MPIIQTNFLHFRVFEIQLKGPSNSGISQRWSRMCRCESGVLPTFCSFCKLCLILLRVFLIDTLKALQMFALGKLKNAMHFRSTWIHSSSTWIEFRMYKPCIALQAENDSILNTSTNTVDISLLIAYLTFAAFGINRTSCSLLYICICEQRNGFYTALSYILTGSGTVSPLLFTLLILSTIRITILLRMALIYNGHVDVLNRNIVPMYSHSCRSAPLPS